jgi:hypothetical protein
VAEVVASEHFRVGSIAIGTSSFADVMAKFGDTETFTSGVEHAPRLACYRALDDDDDTVLLFEAGPMGGWKRLTGISVTNTTLWNHPRQCNRSALVNKRLATASGLRLGLPVADLVKFLGEPTIRNDRFFGYYFEMQEGDWTRTSVIEGALKEEAVVSITVHQIVTN